MWSKCRAVIKFWGLGHFKIKWVLEVQKLGFGRVLEAQVGVENRTYWPQEALGPDLGEILSVFLSV